MTRQGKPAGRRPWGLLVAGGTAVLGVSVLLLAVMGGDERPARDADATGAVNDSSARGRRLPSLAGTGRAEDASDGATGRVAGARDRAAGVHDPALLVPEPLPAHERPWEASVPAQPLPPGYTHASDVRPPPRPAVVTRSLPTEPPESPPALEHPAGVDGDRGPRPSRISE